MSFNFKPLSDDQLSNRNLLPAGIYDFKVIDAVETISKKGNPMITLTVRIEHEGTSHVIYDYLVSMESMIYKIKNFCDGVGIEDKYVLGQLAAEDCLEHTGSAKVDIEPERVNPNSLDGSTYPAKNVIRRYMKKFETLKSNGIKGNVGVDLDVPF